MIAGVDADELVDLICRAPAVFDVRRASTRLHRPQEDDYDPFCAEYRSGEHVVGSKRPVERYCGLSLVVSPELVSSEPKLVKDVAEAVAWARPFVSRAEHRKALRAKWDRETNTRSK